MAHRPARFRTTCLAAVGALVSLVILGPACSDTSKNAGDTGSAGSGAAEAGTSGSSTSGGSSSGAADAGGAASGAADAGGASGGTAEGGVSSGGTEGGSTPLAGSGNGGQVGGEGGSSSEGAECVADEDCVVFSDCCTCSAVPTTNQPAECEKLCIQSACAARGLEGIQPRCRGKRCVLDLSCDQAQVTCKVATPTCDAGLVPSVVETCWGPCVAPDDCDGVTDCKDCLAGQVCVDDSQGFASYTRCVEVAPACAAKPSCACTDACQYQCSDADGIGCFCIAC